MYEQLTDQAMDMLRERNLGMISVEYAKIAHDPRTGGLRYPCYSPSGALIHRIKSPPDHKARNLPKYISPRRDTIPDDLLFYAPAGWETLRDEINAAGGELILLEGEPDVWASIEAGRANASAFFGWGNTLSKSGEGIQAQLADLGVRQILHIYDADEAGRKGAAALCDLMRDSIFSIITKPAGELGTKTDLNDLWIRYRTPEKLWQAIEAIPADDPGELMMSLPAPKTLSTLQAQPDLQSRFFAKYVDKVKSLLPPSDKREGNVERFHCVNPSHPDEHPSARVSYDVETDLGIYICNCQSGINWKQVGDWVGYSWEEYLAENEQEWVQRENTIKNENREAVQQAAKDLTMNVSVDVLDRIVDQRGINLNDIVYTRRQALELYAQRLRGEVIIPHIPTPNPIRSLHPLGGMAELIPPGLMWFIKGGTGGGKTMLSDMLVDILAQQGHDGVVFSGEWRWWRQAERAVQRQDEDLASLSPAEVAKFEIARKETQDYGAPRFGIIPDQGRVDHSIRVANWIARFPGEIFYIDQFGIDILTMLVAIRKLVTGVRKKQKFPAQGNIPARNYDPKYILLDYLQMLQLPSIVAGQMSMEHIITLIKAVASDLGVFVILLSQITKEGDKRLQSGKDATGEEGMYVRDFQANLATTILTKSTHDQKHGLMEINVTKNSEGRRGKITLPVEWERMAILDQPLTQDEIHAITGDDDHEVGGHWSDD